MIFFKQIKKTFGHYLLLGVLRPGPSGVGTFTPVIGRLVEKMPRGAYPIEG